MPVVFLRAAADLIPAINHLAGSRPLCRSSRARAQQATIVLACTDNQAAFGAARPSPQDHAATRGNAAPRDVPRVNQPGEEFRWLHWVANLSRKKSRITGVTKRRY
jgi:hypothetical protein